MAAMSSAGVVEQRAEPSAAGARQEELYQRAAAEQGPALQRLVRAYEANADRRRDLLQEINVAIWRSLAGFDGRCSLRTWVYRVAQNVAASHVARDHRLSGGGLVSLAQLEALPASDDVEGAVAERRAFERLLRLLQRLTPIDRQVVLLHLEGEGGADIAEITGLSPENVAVKIHRSKSLLARLFQEGEQR